MSPVATVGQLLYKLALEELWYHHKKAVWIKPLVIKLVGSALLSNNCRNSDCCRRAVTAPTPTARLAHTDSDLQLLPSAPATQAQIYTLNCPFVPTVYTGKENGTAANLLYKPETVHCLSFIIQRQPSSQITPLIQLQGHQTSDGLRNRQCRVLPEPKSLPSCRVWGHDRGGLSVNYSLPPFSSSSLWAFFLLSSFWSSSSFVVWGSCRQRRSCRGAWGEPCCARLRHPHLDTEINFY